MRYLPIYFYGLGGEGVKSAKINSANYLHNILFFFF